MNAAIDSRTAPYAAVLLRISLGIMFLAHSVYLKLVVFTLPGTAQYFGSLGLPPESAYLVFAAETAGGLALILGYQTRTVAVFLIPVLLGATWAHSGNGWVFSAEGGGWEYPLFLAVTAVVQALLGGGAYALTKREPIVEAILRRHAEAA